MKPGFKSKFEEFSPLADEFKKLWLAADRDGIQNDLADHFGVSVATISRIRKKLNLPTLHGGDHPGRKALIKRIKKLYWKGRSSLSIAKIVRLNDQSILNILHKENVPLRDQHVTNPLYFSVKSSKMTTAQAIVKIKKLYWEGLPLYKIAEEVGVDQGTVSNKLKGMGLNTKRKHNNRSLKGGYPCLWCNQVMDTVWQNKGSRKQKYCSGSCKNKAKDLRKLLRGQKNSRSKERLIGELRSFHPKNYAIVYYEIINVKPVLEVGSHE